MNKNRLRIPQRAGMLLWIFFLPMRPSDFTGRRSLVVLSWQTAAMRCTYGKVSAQALVWVPKKSGTCVALGAPLRQARHATDTLSLYHFLRLVYVHVAQPCFDLMPAHLAHQQTTSTPYNHVPMSVPCPHWPGPSIPSVLGSNDLSPLRIYLLASFWHPAPALPHHPPPQASESLERRLLAFCFAACIVVVIPLHLCQRLPVLDQPVLRLAWSAAGRKVSRKGCWGSIKLDPSPTSCRARVAESPLSEEQTRYTQAPRKRE
ncbi:hypothetical protein GGTG_13198 [Gaeumannomyces tritici R3-111a-1]|uniref:Uncharacterized protein n=1 Tax=Gaeumannomyces tritici (strain R3-111a-1) TaxID=644352 RepID=J3PI70_GAET3|nr:hypothetical protein GGTG_13198 [Gaeumannomyces tritici R3-111a-1]EJT69582.1 hypothetical protein GGTG_13198 [Gaeumannomyces tritici R3-111a-1]